MMTKLEIQARVGEASGAAEKAREKYIDALKLAKVAKVEVKESRKEWKRANIQLAKAQGMAIESELEDGWDDEACT